MNQRGHIYVLFLVLSFTLPLLSMTTYALSDTSLAIAENTVTFEAKVRDEPQDDSNERTDSLEDDTTSLSVVQIITSFGVIATAILGIANLITSVRQIHVNGVCSKRAQWIESVREITANIVCYDLRKVEDKEQFEEEFNGFVKNAYKLSLYLNIQGPFDRVVLDYLIEFVKSQRMRSNDFVNNRRMLNFAVQVYLKSEWNRIKHESKIISFKKYDEKESITQILDALEGGYVDKLRQQYQVYLNGGKMGAPVFFEFIELSFDPPIKF